MNMNMTIPCAIVLGAVILGLSVVGARADDEKERRSITEEVLRRLLDRAPTEREISADMSWYQCTEHAVDLFASQPEPATVIAEAAIESCAGEGMRYMATFKIRYHKDFGQTDKPALIARVLAVRSVKQGASAGKPDRAAKQGLVIQTPDHIGDQRLAPSALPR